MGRNPCVVIVDAYSSTWHLVPLFNVRGYDCVHVQSVPEVPTRCPDALRQDGFAALITHEHDLERTVRRVAELAPVAVLAGHRSGAVLADSLSAALELRGNGTRRSAARQRRTGRRGPAGAGFRVHSVSLDGLHYISDIWEVVPGAGGSRFLRLLERRGRLQDELADRTFEELDAVALRNGAAAVDFGTEADGLRLAGLAAGLSGSGLPLLAGSALGEGQLDWVVDAYVAPERFRLRAANTYRIARHAACVRLGAPDPEILEQLKKLESYHGSSGSESGPISIHLLHPEESAVLRDCRRLGYTAEHSAL